MPKYINLKITEPDRNGIIKIYSIKGKKLSVRITQFVYPNTTLAIQIHFAARSEFKGSDWIGLNSLTRPKTGIKSLSYGILTVPTCLSTTPLFLYIYE